jgi:hypothetical protein
MSIQQYHSTRPPGWYPDPAGGPNSRWFNGTAWTHRYHPPVQQFAPPPPAECRFTIHYGLVAAAMISLLVTLVPSIFWFVAAGSVTSDPSTERDGAGAAAVLSMVMAVLWMLWGGMWTLIWTASAIHHTLRGRQR